MSADVELQNVSVTFGSFYAAKNVSVKIREGEFFSFLGPSGCGKTTLLRAISGFLDPSEGKVLIGGQDMALAIDGQVNEYLKSTAKVMIQKASFEINMVNFTDSNYFNTLRTKLGWGVRGEN